MMTPNACHILAAEQAAARSPCAKSKRGVVLFDPSTDAHRGAGWNGPPLDVPCPGREVCGERCSKLCVHAEIRALRSWMQAGRGGSLHLLHVKLGSDGHVTPGGPPSCWQCSREILDVGFVAGVWLYELSDWLGVRMPPGHWRYYTAADFHAVTLRNAELVTAEEAAGRVRGRARRTQRRVPEADRRHGQEGEPMTMKLAQLRAAERAMLGGRWTSYRNGPYLEIESSLQHPDGATIGVAEDLRSEDAVGIVALRNAAPQLLALWEACEAERAAVCETESAVTDDYEIAAKFGECAGDTHDDACPVAITRAAVAAVLERGLL